MNMKNPREVIDYLLNVTEDKGNKPFFKLAILGFMAGMFIALGAVGSIVASANLVKTNVGLAKFVAGAVFPVGLMLVLILGSELFTSNCMLFVGVINKRISLFKMFRNWSIVYVFNFIGALFIAYITITTHNFNNEALDFISKLAVYKVHTPMYLLFLKGILCNVLVCGAVLVTYSSNNLISKLFGAWFPIMLFVILGYDHCVANMLYLSAGSLINSVNLVEIGYNLFFVTVGNIVGGALFMSIPLYLAYYKKENK